MQKKICLKLCKEIDNYYSLFAVFNNKRRNNKEMRRYYKNFNDLFFYRSNKSKAEAAQFTKFVFGLNVAAELLASKKLEEEELIKLLTGKTRTEGQLLEKLLKK